MRLLVIGNGYDKMHSLNTSYKDFLDFIEFIFQHRKIKTDFQVLNKADFAHIIDYCKEQLKDGFDGKDNRINNIKWCLMVSLITDEQLMEFISLVEQSFWVDYFREKRNLIGEKWMNFEAELEFVVKEVFNGKNTNRMIQVYEIANKSVANLIIKKKGKYEIYEKELDEMMYEEFNNFRIILDLYMSFIDLMEICPVSRIDSFEYNKIISFNYTHTYERVKKHMMNDICYIHGEAGEKVPPQIVLGFDDHYMNDNIKTIPQHIKYEKYYLRIINKTDNQYYDWLKDAEKEDNVVIDIVGHSLSPADGDIIEKLLMLPNAHINIFYYDDNDRAEKIKNLAIIVGAEKLIALTNGYNRRVVFVDLNVPKIEDFSGIITA